MAEEVIDTPVTEDVPAEQVVVTGTGESPKVRARQKRKATDELNPESAVNDTENILEFNAAGLVPDGYTPSVGIAVMPKRVTYMNGTVIEDH